MAALKTYWIIPSSDSSQLSVTFLFSFHVIFSYLLKQQVIYLFFPPWIFYLLGDFESYLSLLFSSQLPCLGLACGPGLFLWGFNDNSVFRDFTVIFVSAWYLWYH